MLKSLLSLEPESIELCDIGAAFFGEPPPYAALLRTGLGHLTAFEPDTRQVEALRAHLGKRATLIPKALGDGTTQTLNICGPDTGMTSLLEPDPASLAFFNLFGEFGRALSTEKVETHRLDDLDELKAIDFLKMDVQGSELSIICNGAQKLSQSVAAQIEVSFITLYKDQPSFGDIDVEMRRLGFIPHRFMDVKTWPIAPTIRDGNPTAPFHQLLEADVVYIRDIVHPDVFTDLQLKKLAALAHFVFSSADLVVRCLTELRHRGEVPKEAAEDYLISLR